jgi:arabinan endo-1,5-alpha-L-arabinosidase
VRHQGRRRHRPRRLTDNGLTFTSGPHLLLVNNVRSWEGGIIEAPNFVSVNGYVYLLYSGGPWNLSGYGEGSALCTSAAGPCKRLTRVLNASDGRGAGGASTFSLGYGWIGIAWHAWSGSDRRLHVGMVMPAAFGTLQTIPGYTPSP